MAWPCRLPQPHGWYTAFNASIPPSPGPYAQPPHPTPQRSRASRTVTAWLRLMAWPRRLPQPHGWYTALHPHPSTPELCQPGAPRSPALLRLIDGYRLAEAHGLALPPALALRLVHRTPPQPSTRIPCPNHPAPPQTTPPHSPALPRLTNSNLLAEAYGLALPPASASRLVHHLPLQPSTLGPSSSATRRPLFTVVLPATEQPPQPQSRTALVSPLSAPCSVSLHLSAHVLCTSLPAPSCLAGRGDGVGAPAGRRSGGRGAHRGPQPQPQPQSQSSTALVSLSRPPAFSQHLPML